MMKESVDALPGTEQQATEHYPLWINDDWYIPVDERGRCVGVCGEGALGFIVQLLSRNKDQVRALKIPKLTHETNRENAYVSELLSQELLAVQRIGNEAGPRHGLLRATDTSSPLQRPLRIDRLESAKKWDGALIFVRFEKGQNPYFCYVKLNQEVIYPPQAAAPSMTAAAFRQIETNSRSEGYEADGEPTIWRQMVFVEQQQADRSRVPKSAEEMASTNEVVVFNVNGALTPEKSAGVTTWYTCLPSVVYDWAPNTLEEAIGLRHRGMAWSMDNHLQLAENVCQGVKVLHDKKMLHADIRPANIVYLGKAQHANEYLVTDYGSFATSSVQPVSRRDNEPSDHSIVGPVIEGERVSPFYAPERGKARERETADTAIVIDPGRNNATYYVVVGWKTKFMEQDLLDDRAKTKQDAKYYIEFMQRCRTQYVAKHTSANLLQTGDRIQLRDYVFELASPEVVLGDMQLFECRKLYWTVYHGKIIVREKPFAESCFAFPIPRVVELPHWSAATDIFSLGVLCLYSVYSDFRENMTDREQPQTALLTENEHNANSADNALSDSTNEHSQTSDPFTLSLTTSVQAEHPPQDHKEQHALGNSKQSQLSVTKLDEGFEAMLKYLTDRSLFNAVWPKLEWLRHQIEEKLDKPEIWTANDLATYLFQPHEDLEAQNKPRANGVESNQQSLEHEVASQNASEAEQERKNLPKKRTLQSEALDVISQITSTVPEIERLLKPLSESGVDSAKPMYQLGPFIFYIHFVLRCLHRQDGMDSNKAQKWIDEGWMTVPFCTNRHEAPENGAAGKALDRLRRIRRLIAVGALKGLKTEESSIAKFDLRPENEIRAELAKLQAEKEEWAKERTTLDQQVSEVTNKLQAEKEEWAKERTTLDQQVSEVTNNNSVLDQQIQVYSRAKQAMEDSVQNAISRLENARLLELLLNREQVIEEITDYFSEALSVQQA